MSEMLLDAIGTVSPYIYCFMLGHAWAVGKYRSRGPTVNSRSDT